MSEYTDAMLDHLTLCTGCKKMYYFGDSTYLTCNTCNSREKPAKKEVVMCGSEGCKFQRSVENKYCGKHQICLFVDEVVANGKRVCVNYVRGCRAQLDQTYAFTRCEECLEKDREKDRVKRGKAVEKNNQLVQADVIITHKHCTTCCKELPMELFVGEADGVITKTCMDCRTQNKIQDAKRDKEARNLLAKQNLFAHYSAYRKDTRVRNIPFHLSLEQYTELVNMPCHYCGITETEKGFNGIDRKNSTNGYTPDNCVSCCKMCNYMKGTLDDLCFVKRVGHILSYTGKNTIGKISFPELFGSHISGSYASFKRNAISREYPFEITQEQFNDIIRQDCYLCGKANSETHRNGVDRYNNAIGYLIENCRPCCAECNLMKGINDYDSLVEKLKLIYDKHRTTITLPLHPTYTPEIFVQKHQKRRNNPKGKQPTRHENNII